MSHHDWPEDFDDLSIRGGLRTGLAAVVFGLVIFLVVLFSPAIVLELHRAGVL